MEKKIFSIFFVFFQRKKFCVSEIFYAQRQSYWGRSCRHFGILFVYWGAVYWRENLNFPAWSSMAWCKGWFWAFFLWRVVKFSMAIYIWKWPAELPLKPIIFFRRFMHCKKIFFSIFFKMCILGGCSTVKVTSKKNFSPSQIAPYCSNFFLGTSPSFWYIGLRVGSREKKIRLVCYHEHTKKMVNFFIKLIVAQKVCTTVKKLITQGCAPDDSASL